MKRVIVVLTPNEQMLSYIMTRNKL